MTGKETTTLAMSTKKMRSGDAPRTFFYLAVSVSSRGVSPAAHHLSLPLGSSFSSSVFRVYSPPSTSAFHLRLPPPPSTSAFHLRLLPSFLCTFRPSFLYFSVPNILALDIASISLATHFHPFLISNPFFFLSR